jgi:hypothetical protein
MIPRDSPLLCHPCNIGRATSHELHPGNFVGNSVCCRCLPSQSILLRQSFCVASTGLVTSGQWASAPPVTSERQGNDKLAAFEWLGAATAVISTLFSERRLCFVLGWVVGSESDIKQVLVISPMSNVLAPEVESKYGESTGEPACKELEHARARFFKNNYVRPSMSA